MTQPTGNRCRNCVHFAPTKESTEPLNAGLCLVLMIQDKLPLWAQQSAHWVMSHHGTDCPAFHAKRGTDQ